MRNYIFLQMADSIFAAPLRTSSTQTTIGLKCDRGRVTWCPWQRAFYNGNYGPHSNETHLLFRHRCHCESALCNGCDFGTTFCPMPLGNCTNPPTVPPSIRPPVKINRQLGGNGCYWAARLRRKRLLGLQLPQLWPRPRRLQLQRPV